MLKQRLGDLGSGEYWVETGLRRGLECHPKDALSLGMC